MKTFGVNHLVTSLLLALVAPPALAVSMNLELWEMTGENPAARNVYICDQCTLEQFLAVPLPGPNWKKNASEGNARLFLPDEGTSVPPTPPPGTPSSLDLVPEIEGDDHFLIAQVLSATLVGFGAQGIMAIAQVARGTTMTFYAGRVIHKLTDSEGIEYVLFSMSEDKTTTFDPFVWNGLAGMSVPTGWIYSSEVLAENLVVVTPGGIASVFSVPDYWSWQKVESPDPMQAEAKLKIRLRFDKPSRDKILVLIKNWQLPEGVVPTDVTVNVGGAACTWTLDAEGRSQSPDKRDSIEMKQDKATQLWTLTAKRKKNDFAADLWNEGCTNADNPEPGMPVTVPLIITVDGVAYGQDVDLVYKSRPSSTAPCQPIWVGWNYRQSVDE